MPIALYFVAGEKESVPPERGIPIPYSLGLGAQGALRRPKNIWQNVPLILDDAIIGPMSENLRAQLLNELTHGCILDFERPVQSFHAQWLQVLRREQITPLWMPERFQPRPPREFPILSANLPHNSWQEFCRSIAQRYPEGWVLELQPVRCQRRLPCPQEARDFYLPDAICRCKLENQELLYYDTVQTLEKKLLVAQKFGCFAALALWQEWKDLPYQ